MCYEKNVQQYLHGFSTQVSSTSECLQKCSEESFYFAYTGLKSVSRGRVFFIVSTMGSNIFIGYMMGECLYIKER